VVLDFENVSLEVPAS